MLYLLCHAARCMWCPVVACYVVFCLAVSYCVMLWHVVRVVLCCGVGGRVMKCIVVFCGMLHDGVMLRDASSCCVLLCLAVWHIV